MNVSLYDLIERSAVAALELQGSDGAMPPGRNGPWNDPQTPVRNTGYWLITFLKVHSLTGKPVFLKAAGRAADYLASPEARPMGAAFWHRNTPGKDPGNGLIGQAWTIEALGIGSLQLERPELGKLAEQLFLQHPFDYSTALWRRLNVDGTTAARPMGVFNQHVWLAAAGGMLTTGSSPGLQEIRSRTLRFIDCFKKYLRFGPHGIIAHNFTLPGLSIMNRCGKFIRRLRSGYQNFHKSPRNVGYHSFNLYGLALLKQIHPSHPVWITRRLDPMWQSIDSGQFDRLAQGNPYCYLYNPAGIEIAFALQVLRTGMADAAREYLQTQFSRCFDISTGLMQAGGTSDPVTLAARLYEATRLPDHNFQL